MSYSIRNTLVLALTFFILTGVSSIWLYFYEYKPLESKEEVIKGQEVQLASLKSDASRFNDVYDIFNSLNHNIDNYPKTLFPDSKLSGLYDYLRKADPQAAFMNFVFTDSTRHGKYGKVRFTVDGATDYRQLRDFIYTLENATPLVKFTSVQIRPSNNRDNLHEVGFRIYAEAYYDRTGRDAKLADAEPVRAGRQHNPFFPLIHDVPANEHNRIDVERSRLTAMGEGFIFLVDQNGMLQRLETGNRVHLGHLESISKDQRTATFFLNKGGLVERITLRIKQ